ncbi:uncharacterized protein LOC144453775 [Glandiceps talaboti]
MPSSQNNWTLRIVLCSVITGQIVHSLPKLEYSEIPVWTWVDGLAIINQTSRFDIHGNNQSSQEYPGARSGSAVWQDSNGDVWMFGGEGIDSRQVDDDIIVSDGGDTTYLLNSLWQFEMTKQTWKAVHQGGKDSLVPSSRHYAAACGLTDKFVLIYGGLGYNYTAYDDLWLFDLQRFKWQQLKFTQRNDHFPEARGDAIYWCTQESLWIFGGLRSNSEVLSDFWKFSMTSKTWEALNLTMEKSERELVASLGQKSGAAKWIVNEEYLYMFGGNTLQNFQHYRHLVNGLTSDLWKYSIERKTWRFVRGFTERKQPGKYGTIWETSPENNPGCRQHSMSWVDGKGDLWLFGGEGIMTDPVINMYSRTHPLSDLWKFNTTVDMWTWMGGAMNIDAGGFYGVKGEQDIKNQPTPRCEAITVTYNDTVYLFGGLGHDRNDDDGWLNDLWTMVLVNTSTYNHALINGKKIPLSPTEAFLMTLGIIVAISILFVFATWGKKCCNLPRHKPSAKSPAGFDVKYSPLSDDTEFTITGMSTSMKDIPNF